MKRLTIAVLSLAISVCLACGSPSEGTSAGAPSEDASAAGGQAAPKVAQASSDQPQEARQPVIRKGGQAPMIKTMDIRGLEVDLEKIIAQEPDLIIEFFFSVHSGEEIAKKLRMLDKKYRDSVQVIALGMKEEEEELKKFASDFDIDYYIIERDSLGDSPWVDEVNRVPLTVFIHPDDDRQIVRILKGSGTSTANLIREVAQNFFQQKKLDQAQILGNEAREAGEDDKKVRELAGFILTAQGKLDEAAVEFGAIGSNEGMARVAFERGDYDKAVALTQQAGPNSAYADTIKGMAFQRQGKLDAAAGAFQSATEKEGEDWQKSEALNGRGRILHQNGLTDEAIEYYRKAIDLSLYNVTALSNEGAAHRDNGNLDEAARV